MSTSGSQQSVVKVQLAPRIVVSDAASGRVFFGGACRQANRVVIQDSHTVVTLDQLGVSHDLVEHLRTESDVADGAMPVARLDHCET
jgi:hypothetical protein